MDKKNGLITKKNNVYIGNRYVPVFANPVEWDNLREYEPLTIVTHQGTSYTSKKTVPVGTELSDTEYWVVTGNYNQQVEAYRQEVGELSKSFTELSGNFTELSGNVTELSTELRGDITDLTNKVNSIPINLKDKNLFVVGDSWASGFTDSTGQGFVDELRDRNIFKSVNKYSLGGIGYVAANGSTTLITKLQALESEYHDHLEDVNIIIVEGGVNDYPYSETEIKNAARTLFTYAKSHFPHSQIYAIANITSTRSATNYSKSEAPLRVASECGCIPLYWPHRMLYGHQTQFTNDKFHIKHEACVFYANNIINNMLGYFAFDSDGNDVSTTLGTSPVTNFSTQSQIVSFHERYVDLEINVASGVPNTDASVPLFEFTNDMLPSITISKAYSLYKPAYTAPKVFSSGSNLYHQVNEFIMSNDGKVGNIFSAANFNGVMTFGYMHFRFDRLARTFV